MLELRTIDISDKDWICRALTRSDFRGCEYSFANNMAWRRMADTQITRISSFYLPVSSKYGIRYTFPSGGDKDTPLSAYRKLFELMRKNSEEQGQPLVISSVTKDNIGIFEELYSGRYDTETDTADWDYVYNSSDLTELSGRKYHGKRNHLKKISGDEYEYTELSDADIDDCLSFAVNSYNMNRAYDDHSQVCEQFAIDTYFRYYHELGLCGGVLRKNGKVIAFTIGERLNSDTFGVHIEKADPSIEGAYPAINNFFARAHASHLRYINREEDLGIEGLRKAKQSYHPVFMIEKYTVKFR